MLKDTIFLIQKLNLKPGKSLGQNFMVDENFLDFILREANPQKSDIVLEVGPGLGALTRRLLGKVKTLFAIELDIKLFSYLKEEFLSHDFVLIHGDALNLDLKNLFSSSEYSVISNMPYSISTPFILHLIESKIIPNSMHLVLQEDVTDKFCSFPGDKNYGASSVIAQSFFEVKKIRKIPKEVFFPRPDISSALTKFSRKKFPAQLDIEDYFKLVKTSFAKRRKTLANNLSEIFPSEIVHSIFDTFSLHKNVRAEELSPNLYINIAKFANPTAKL